MDMKVYNVNGKPQKLTEAQVESLKEIGIEVEIPKPVINKERTAFERLIAKQYSGFRYFLSINGIEDPYSLILSTSLSWCKKQVYALIEDQVDNEAETFEEPIIYFYENLNDSKLLFAMKLVYTDSSEFVWVTHFIDEDIEIPEEITDSEETTDSE